MSLGYLPVVTSNDRRMDLRKIRTRYVGTGECLNFEVSTRTEPKFPWTDTQTQNIPNGKYIIKNKHATRYTHKGRLSNIETQ